MRYTVIIESGRESGYVALCPALPGCLSQGRTRREVLRNIREAIEAYVESLLEDGLPVPVERGREMVEVEVAASLGTAVCQRTAAGRSALWRPPGMATAAVRHPARHAYAGGPHRPALRLRERQEHAADRQALVPETRRGKPRSSLDESSRARPGAGPRLTTRRAP